MASTIWSFLKAFGPRAARTSTAPNSRAVISLWRRCFELQDQQEEEKLEEIVRALEEDIFELESSPIRSRYAEAARADILADYYRDIMARRQPTMRVATAVHTSTSPAEMQMNTPPSLLVPSQDGSPDYIYLPQ